jgi:hypothetical protein
MPSDVDVVIKDSVKVVCVDAQFWRLKVERKGEMQNAK